MSFWTKFVFKEVTCFTREEEVKPALFPRKRKFPITKKYKKFSSQNCKHARAAHSITPRAFSYKKHSLKKVTLVQIEIFFKKLFPSFSSMLNWKKWKGAFTHNFHILTWTWQVKRNIWTVCKNLITLYSFKSIYSSKRGKKQSRSLIIFVLNTSLVSQSFNGDYI